MSHASIYKLAGIFRLALLGAAFIVLSIVMRAPAHAHGAIYWASYTALPPGLEVTVRGLFVEAGFESPEAAAAGALNECEDWLDSERDRRATFNITMPCTMVPNSAFGSEEDGSDRCGIVAFSGNEPVGDGPTATTATNPNNCAPADLDTDREGASTMFCNAACDPMATTCNHISRYDITTGGCVPCPATQIQHATDNTRCAPRSVNVNASGDNTLVNNQPSPTPVSKNNNNVYGLVGLGAVGVMGIVLMNQNDGNFAFNPHAEIRHVGDTFTEYGARLDYSEDDWAGYWTASRDNGGDWRYGTGAKWTGDVFSAGFANTAGDHHSDSQFSVAARGEWGVWTLDSTYAADWAVTKTDDEWTNRLSAGASAEYARWTISPRAELAWQPDAGVGNDIRFRVNFLRDL